MNRDCKEGLRLRLHFEHTLKEWGWFDAYEKALELMPVSPPQVHEFQLEAHQAHTALIVVTPMSSTWHIVSSAADGLSLLMPWSRSVKN